MFGLNEILIVSVHFGNKDSSFGSISKGYSIYSENETGRGEADETSIFYVNIYYEFSSDHIYLKFISFSEKINYGTIN